MRRRLFNVLALLSLLLCVTTAALWARSYSRGDFVTRFRSGIYREIASCRGQLYIQTGPTSYPDGSSWTVREPVYLYLQGIPTIDWQFLGFQEISGAILNGIPGRRFSVLVVPFWSFVLLLAAAPGYWVLGRVLLRRARVAGRCPACGYDLRATPDRCPECGAVPRAPRTAA